MIFAMRALLLAWLFLAAGLFSGGPPAAVASSPLTATDLRGRTLTLAQPAQRVVCLIESALSGIYMLGQGHKVVGVSTDVYQEPVYRYYAQLDERLRWREVPAPGNWDFLSLEGVLALQPDLVILWAQQTEAIAALEERGVPVFGVFINTRQDLWREIEALGLLLGTPARAAALVQLARKEEERLTARLAGLQPAQRPRVYFMWAQGYLESSGAGSMVDELLTLAGGRNVCGHLPQEHVRLRLEQLLAWQPEVIIMWPHPRLRPEELLAEEQWQLLPAVRERRVYQLPEVFLSDLWTLKYLLAVQQVAVWLHPQRFAGLDLAAERRRLLRELYGLTFED